MQIEDAKLKAMVDNAAELTETARELSERDRDYYDGYQWTASEQAVLRKRKQPEVTDNRIRRKIDAIVGLEQKGRVDPRGLPRNPDDEEAADIATKALVFVDDITSLDALRSQFCYNLAIEGYGGVEVVTKERKGLTDPDIIRLRWEEIFYDPHSRETDFSDAEFMGVQKWMSIDRAVAFAQEYSGLPPEELEAMFEASMYNTATGQTYEDRPDHANNAMWGDKKKRRVKLAYMYYRSGGKWYLALLSGKGTIYNELSPYLDGNGEPENAIILQSCYVDRENRRAGIVRDMVSQQDEINKRRSKLLHMLNSRQTMGQTGATKLTGAALKRELAAPDGHVEYDQDPSTSVPSFQIIPQSDQIVGQFQLLEYTTAAIDNLGPNPSVLGEESGATSGRAIMAQQSAGMAELAPFYDALRDWTLRVYRAIWNRIKQFWTEERWIRVTDQPDKLDFVGLNVPEPQMDPMTGQPAMGMDGRPVPQIDPMTGQPVLKNPVAELDVDIIIDMSPDYAILQQEEFERLTDLVGKGMLQLPPDVIIRASQLRNKSELLEAMKGQDESPQAQQMQQMAQQMAQLEMRLKAAEGGLKEAQAAKAQAETREIMATMGQGDPMQPPDHKPALDFEAKKLSLAEQAREHDDKMRLEWSKHQSDNVLKRDQQMLSRQGAAVDGQVKAAQAAKLLRPDPKRPAAGG